MAAAPDPLLSSQKRSNSAKLGNLIFHGGTLVLRSLFDSYHTPLKLEDGLRSKIGILRSLRDSNLISPGEWKILFPDDGSLPTSQNMEAHLLFVLLQNICGLSKPSTGWDKAPEVSVEGNHISGNLAKFNWLISEVASRTTEVGVGIMYFNLYWSAITNVVRNFGYELPFSFEELKLQPMNKDDEDKYLRLLVEWTRKKKMQNQDVAAHFQETTKKINSVLQRQNETKLQPLQLKRSKNAWVRPKDKNQGSADEAKTAELYRKVTSILNKLTPQKFQTLTNQILELEIDTPERLEGVIDRIFEKAISEPLYSVTYANMCNCLTRIKVKFQIEDKEGKEPKEGQLSFRKILLNKCQKEFEKEKSEESAVQAKMDALTQQGLTSDELKLKKAELEEEESKMRSRSLGNIRFIGELFKLKMLTENIMHDCVVKLLRSNDEESYECLCKLLSTIGKDLDHKKAKMRFDQYFDQINKIIHSRRTSSRVRFMMIDVVDLRKNNWVPRREDNNPKTIDQSHKEAQEQEKKTTMLQQAKMPKKESSRGGRDSPRNVGVPQADDGWTSVAKGGAKKAAIHPKTFKKIGKERIVNEAGEQQAYRQPGVGRRYFPNLVPGASSKRGSERERALEANWRQTSKEFEAKPSYDAASSTPASESMEIGADSEVDTSSPAQDLSEDQVRLKTDAMLKEFVSIKDFKNLEFTLQKCPTSNPAQHTSQIQEELRELILKRKARNEEVFEWIDKNVEGAKTKQPPFIKSLVEAVCEVSATQDGSSSVCKCDQDLLKSRKILLQKYIGGNSMLELHALYALQSLAVSLNHPPGFLKSFFNSLYDEDIITADTFYAWEESNDSAESKAKGPALIND